MKFFFLGSKCAALLLPCLFLGAIGNRASAQDKVYERKFSESSASVQNALQKMQGLTAGHLPTLDGFALEGDRPLDRYHRGYFQATTQVSPAGAGNCTVRVTAKVTAWYEDPSKTHSGYELLHSNGRIESDILDRLSEELATNHPAQKEQVVVESKSAVAPRSAVTKHEQPESTISAPQPRLFDSPSVSSSLARGLADAGKGVADAAPAPKPAPDPERAKLQEQVAQLQEALNNQAHPKNMAAVKKSGTAVVANPSLTEKPMFLAAAHDEFEILNYNQDWVHVRISGLSRGWIWRNDLELPDSIPDTPTAAPSSRSAEVFHIVREETSQFPGDWAPLRGKNVKLISVQKIDESSKDSGSQLRLEFAKTVFEKEYADLARTPDGLAGIVLIFDSADGGMIAAPQSILEKWKSGAVSESAFWQNCYFDPPEAFSSGGNAGTQ